MFEGIMNGDKAINVLSELRMVTIMRVKILQSKRGIVILKYL